MPPSFFKWASSVFAPNLSQTYVSMTSPMAIHPLSTQPVTFLKAEVVLCDAPLLSLFWFDVHNRDHTQEKNEHSTVNIFVFAGTLRGHSNTCKCVEKQKMGATYVQTQFVKDTTSTAQTHW